jgi:hypothetical protein
MRLREKLRGQNSESIGGCKRKNTGGAGTGFNGSGCLRKINFGVTGKSGTPACTEIPTK